MSEQQPSLTAELPDSPLTPEEQAQFAGIAAEFNEGLNPAETDRKLADILEATHQFVPDDVPQAEVIGSRLSSLYGNISTHPDVGTLNADLIDELKGVAEKGPLIWKLNHDERALWAGVAGTGTYKRLPRAVQQWTEAKFGSDMTKIDLLREARDEAHKRLNLDDALSDKYGETETTGSQVKSTELVPAGEILDGELEDTEPAIDEIVIDDDSKELVTTNDKPEHLLQDIVGFSANGRARRGTGKSFNDHKFMSKYELEQVEAHAGQIREGLGKHERLIGIMALDSRGLGHRANGQIMSREEVKALNAERRAGLIAEQKAEAALGVPAPTEEDVNNGGQGRWARLKGWASKKKAELYTFAGNPVNYLKERRSEASPEKKLMTDVLTGALALGAVGVTLYLIGKHGQGAELAQHHAPLNGDSGLAQHYAPLNGGSANAAEHVQALAATGAPKPPHVTYAPSEHIVTLTRGDNPWAESHTYLQSLGLKNPTNAQIAAVDAETMRLNGINVAAGQDHALPAGFQLHMPSLDWLRAHGILS